MKAVKSLDVGSLMLYGFVLVAIWTLVFGVYYWLYGWIFGAQSWFIDVNLVNWAEYSLTTLFYVVVRMFLNGLGGALVGLVVAVFYNMTASMMGGIKMELDN